MNAKQRIIALIDAEYQRALENYRSTHAIRVGIDAAANAWDEFYRDDNGVGGFSQNPHNTLIASQNEERAKVYAAQVGEAYRLAINTFLE